MDPTRIAVGGESAGGNLTVALALYARDNDGPQISHLTPYYPFTDTSLTAPDWDNGLMGPIINRGTGELMVTKYGGDDPHNPLINLVGADLKGLPPTMVVTCGYDALTTDGRRLVEELERAGVETKHVHYDDMPHGFLMSSRLTTRVDETLGEMARECAAHF
jgi:acetyl esterase